MYTYMHTYNFANSNRFLYTMKMFNVHHIYHVPKCLSCHKAIAVKPGRQFVFYDYLSLSIYKNQT